MRDKVPLSGCDPHDLNIMKYHLRKREILAQTNNLAFALTYRSLGLGPGLILPSILLIAGAVTMPLVCYLSAWKPLFRNIFFIPAVSVTLAIGLFLWRILRV